MRTNIVIDDKLMAAAMAGGHFKTKREAVEEGLRQIARRHAYQAIRAARGTLHWDDSDEAWANAAKERAAEAAVLKTTSPTTPPTVQELAAEYKSTKVTGAARKGGKSSRRPVP